ncbi:SusC/RagA family TonB-linked outer membrane protein [Bacteroides nordii]|uniref:SusC/RagA family TonB-linked outer membrane protein n=1 Tax=Bacteroides nordii TaxID=291645 RepID=UPI0034A34F35
MKNCMERKGLSLFRNVFNVFLSLVILGISVPDVYAGDDQVSSHSATQQIKTIKGVVKDKSGEPLPGVNVSVKGATTGGITDVNGEFVLNLSDPARAILVFSYVGFKTLETKVGSGTTLNIVMDEDAETLDEIVVIGYGTQKKTSLTASVGVVKGTDMVAKPVSNLSSAMAGRVAGLITAQTSGEIGNDETSINIRGVATYGNASPLIVVDGVPRNTLNKLDPNSIESVTVLKDAAAVAPYGMAGANGVILVTTKRGKEGKVSLSYNGYVGFQNPTTLLKMMDSYQYVTARNAASYNQNPRAKLPYAEDVVEMYRQVCSGEIPASDLYANTNAYDELRNKNNPITSHNVSLTAGSDVIKAYVGLGYQYQAGMWSTSHSRRINLTSNVDIKATKTTTVGVAINGWNELIERPSATGKDIFGTATQYLPINKIFYSNGLRANSRNSIIDTESGKVSNDQTKIMLQAYLEQDLSFITKGLSAKAIGNYDPTTVKDKDWHEPKPTYYTYNAKTDKYDATVSSDKYSLGQSTKNWRELTGQLMLNYNRTFGKHAVGALAVWEARKTLYDYLSASRNNYNLAIDEIDFGGANPEDKDNGGGSSRETQMGYLFRGTYAYAGKYMIELSGRYDGHYYFAPGKKYGFFPAVSAGWRLSEEKFIKDNIPFIDNLKLRFSYGESGNLAGGAFQYSSAMGIYSNAWKVDGNTYQGAQERIEPNLDITWEKARKADIGLDLTMWNGLLDLEFDYFHEKRNNMLVTRGSLVPVEYAIPLAQVNAGIMKNQGIDLTLKSTKQITRDFGYNVSFNFTYAKNKLIETYENPLTKDDPNRARTGRPLWTRFGLKSDGLFQEGDFDEKGKLKEGIPNHTFSKVAPGDIRYVDVNGDGKITADDETAIGYSMLPEIVYGLNLGVNWKGIDASILFQGTGHSDIILGADIVKPFATGGNGAAIAMDWWTPENTDAEFPRIFGAGGNLNNQQTSDFFLRSASYLRLKNVEVGYTLPKSVVNFLKIQSIRIYFSGQNLLTFSGLKDLMDPEMSQAGDGDSNVRGWYVPQQKVFAFGLNVNF